MTVRLGWPMMGVVGRHTHKARFRMLTGRGESVKGKTVQILILACVFTFPHASLVPECGWVGTAPLWFHPASPPRSIESAFCLAEISVLDQKAVYH